MEGGYFHSPTPTFLLHDLHGSTVTPWFRSVVDKARGETSYLGKANAMGALRATTNHGGLPSGFAAGMACRRFDLKVELQAIRLLFDIPAPSTFVKRRRAIPTFGSRQAPRHEPGFARHEYPRISQLQTLFPRCVFLDRINRIYKILAVCKCFGDFIILIIL